MEQENQLSEQASYTGIEETYGYGCYWHFLQASSTDLDAGERSAKNDETTSDIWAGACKYKDAFNTVLMHSRYCHSSYKFRKLSTSKAPKVSTCILS